MTRKALILAGFALLLVLLGLVSWVSYASLQDVIEAQARQEISFELRHALSRVVSLIADAETAQRGYIITGNDAFLEPYNRARENLPPELQTLADLLPREKANSEQLARLKQLSAEKLQVIERNIAARREFGPAEAEKRVSAGQGKQVMDAVRALVSAMDTLETERLAQHNEQFDRAAARAVRIVIAGSVLAFLCGAFSLDQVRRAIREKTRARKTVEELNARLEERVQERTLMWRDAVMRLQEEIEERKQLENEVLQISEREQRRIAQDLHDGLGQLLAGALHLSTALEQRLQPVNPAEASEAQNLRELMKEALDQTRATSHGLYPVKDMPKGLVFALKDLAHRAEMLFEIECHFICPHPVLIDDNPAATHLYRIAQEAISNAVKHGRATKVVLSLVRELNGVVLEIRDNGAGFAPESREKNGMGTRIMQHRAEMLNGILNIEELDAGGVLVRCAAPLLAAEPRDEHTG